MQQQHFARQSQNNQHNDSDQENKAAGILFTFFQPAQVVGLDYSQVSYCLLV